MGCDPSKRLNIGTPFRWLYLPVRMLARLGVQIEFAQKQASNRMPSRASRSRFGVWLIASVVGADGLRGMVVGHDEQDVRPRGCCRKAGAIGGLGKPPCQSRSLSV